jgi:YfiH family protein
MGAAIGDTPKAVAENRRLVREALRLPAEPIWLEQVHGTHVVELGGGTVVSADGAAGRGANAVLVGSATKVSASEGASAGGGAGGGGADTGAAAAVRPEMTTADGARAVPKGDASVAWGPGNVCAIRVADCMPVLLAARDGSVVGAAHAGWRGLAGGVLEATVGRMGVPASQLIAWMGPAIGQANFEVGDDVRLAFTGTDPAAASAFLQNARGRWQCDLYALARRRLAALGVAGVYGGGWCTFADSERFFSYRRSSQCGRMAALIWIG